MNHDAENGRPFLCFLSSDSKQKLLAMNWYSKESLIRWEKKLLHVCVCVHLMLAFYPSMVYVHVYRHPQHTTLHTPVSVSVVLRRQAKLVLNESTSGKLPVGIKLLNKRKCVHGACVCVCVASIAKPKSCQAQEHIVFSGRCVLLFRPTTFLHAHTPSSDVYFMHAKCKNVIIITKSKYVFLVCRVTV